MLFDSNIKTHGQEEKINKKETFQNNLNNNGREYGRLAIEVKKFPPSPSCFQADRYQRERKNNILSSCGFYE